VKSIVAVMKVVTYTSGIGRRGEAVCPRIVGHSLGFALPGVDVCVVGMTFDRVEKPHTKSLFALAVDGLLVGLLMLSSRRSCPSFSAA
jgi:hypothetical protein